MNGWVNRVAVGKVIWSDCCGGMTAGLSKFSEGRQTIDPGPTILEDGMRRPS